MLRDVQQKIADVATVAEENIVGVHVVKSFAQEPAEQAKFERALGGASSSRRVRANRQRALYVPLISFLPLLAQAAVLLVGGRHGRRRHALAPARSSRFNLYLGDARACRCACSACGSARRSARPRPASGSSRCIDEPEEVARPRPARASCRPGRGAIRFEGVTFEYRPGAAGARRASTSSSSRAGPSR